MPWRSCACWEMGRRTVVVPSRSSWLRYWAHSLKDSESGPGHLESWLADAVEGAAYVPGGDEAGSVGFFGMFQGVDEEE